MSGTASGNLIEVARRLVIPCVVLSAVLFMLAYIVKRPRRRTLLLLAWSALAVSLVAYAVYFPNSA